MKSWMRQAIRLVRPYKYSALRRLVEPRKFHAFGIGLNKSGTHSIASLLEDNYSTGHEIEHGELIKQMLTWRQNPAVEKQFLDYLKTRDKYAWLELDVSHTHLHYLELLLAAFPNAKFIFTLRDCHSWLDSWLNHSLNNPRHDGPWADLHRWTYGGSEWKHTPEAAILQEKGLYPLEGYLQAWSQLNEKALSLVPEQQLLVVKTQDITNSLDRLAAFLEIPEDSLSPQNAHSYPAKKQHNLLSQIDPAYLEEKTAEHCGPLMQHFFYN